MVQHPSLHAWEQTLKKVLDDLDDRLENLYGKSYTLHPARSARGKTSNKAHDGLFDIVAAFSLGAGSKHGKGYVIDVNMATLDHVPEAVQKEINALTLSTLRDALPRHFPGKNLSVDMDGRLIKIHGDLSLGEA